MDVLHFFYQFISLDKHLIYFHFFFFTMNNATMKFCVHVWTYA